MEEDLFDARKVQRAEIRYKNAPYAFTDLRIGYPASVVQALCALYEEYNQQWVTLLRLNREWKNDYQLSYANARPINWGVQIDMVGLDEATLRTVSVLEPALVREVLRGRIFEIENSLALYHLLDRICDSSSGDRSFYSRHVRSLLDSLRGRFARPIALLAPTEAKYEAMLESEFGMATHHPSACEVRELTGFDAFMGPEQFRRHLAENRGECRYALYARASDPVSKLKQPSLRVEHPLLSDTNMRRTIKAHCITFNIDNPAWPIGDERRINDTKMYLPAMGMAQLITREEDLSLLPYDTERILRAKPTQGTYGCYGHFRGCIGDVDFRRRLRHAIRDRGPYVLQPEHNAPKAFNYGDGISYDYIDRVFVGMLDCPTFLGGFREYLPSDSHEAQSGRLHGNKDTVFAEIV